jgi:ribosomal protein S19
MSRSIKKGPFIDFKLDKRVSGMNEGGKNQYSRLGPGDP